MKTIIVDDKIFAGLRTLDNWLAKQPWNKNIELSTVMEVRELITKIQANGYYTNLERDVLNVVRHEWWRHTYGNTGKMYCRFCCKCTEDVEYDYLDGTDHLECVLKWEQTR